MNIQFFNKLKNKGFNFKIYDTIESTNKLLKEMAENGEKEKTVIIAQSQTNGRGRLGRNFFSPDGTGLYMSILLKPQISPENALLITTTASVAVAEAIEKLSNRQTGIKWVNDIYIDGKKVCGILTEASFEQGLDKLKYAVLGIGINLFAPKNGFPADIKNTASFIFNDVFDNATELLICEILRCFQKYYNFINDTKKCTSPNGPNELFCEYKKRCIVLEKEVYLLKGEEKIPAFVLDLNPDFSLKVRTQSGDIINVSSGDISLRFAT